MPPPWVRAGLLVWSCRFRSEALVAGSEASAHASVGSKCKPAAQAFTTPYPSPPAGPQQLSCPPCPPAEVYGFSSERKMASVLVRRNGALRLYNKGAAEMVLTRCTAMVNAAGETVPMTEVGWLGLWPDGQLPLVGRW